MGKGARERYKIKRETNLKEILKHYQAGCIICDEVWHHISCKCKCHTKKELK